MTRRPIPSVRSARALAHPANVMVRVLDPSMVADRYVPAIVARLSGLDPQGAATYAANGESYRAAVQAMDAANMKKLEAIPAADRKLVTFHVPTS